MDTYIITFQDKESTYTKDVIESIEYINKLISFPEKEAQERRISLPFPSYVFDYVVGRISTVNLFNEYDGQEIMLNLIRLADYTCDAYIKRLTVGLLDYEEEKIVKGLTSYLAIIGELPRFFIDAKSRYCCHILRRDVETFSKHVNNITKSELLTMCEILQHSELSRVVNLVAKWESAHNSDLPSPKVTNEVWDIISNYRFCLRRDTFEIIANLNPLLLTKQLVMNHLKDMPIIYDRNKEHRKCVYVRYPAYYKFKQIGDENLTVSVRENALVITSTEHIQDVIVTMFSGEYECFYIGDMDKHTQFVYKNVISREQYHIYYTEEY